MYRQFKSKPILYLFLHIVCVCLAVGIGIGSPLLPPIAPTAGAVQADSASQGDAGGTLPGASPASAAYTNTISQWGMTWTFDKPYQYGQFANGDYWIVVDPGTNTAVITSITPNVQQVNIGGTPYYVNGWEVNPIYEGPQGFDERAGGFSAALIPALPYNAQGGQSIVKAISRNLTEVKPRPTLETAAVLTVLSSPPPDGTGAGYFRPPYVGTDKPYYAISSIRADLLPRYAPVANTPTLDTAIESMQRLQMDHKGGMPGAYIRPVANLGGDYAPSMARFSTDAILRLMVYDPADDPAKKQQLLIDCLQKGIDMYHFVLLGQTWPSGGGHQPGHLLPLTFAATMLDHDGMKSVVASPTLWHEGRLVYRGTNGVALYGIYDEYWSEERYWHALATQSIFTSERDPYDLIDGGYTPGGGYQFCCISQPWKGEALAFHLFGALKNVWNRSDFFDYVDRWVTLGAYTQPDVCAPAPFTLTEEQWNNRAAHGYGTTWGPDPAHPGLCIKDTNPDDGIGRFPALHGTNADGGYYYTDFQKSMWKAYRYAPPSLALHGAPADHAIHLTWEVNTPLPPTATWRVDYYTETAAIYTVTDPYSTTRSLVLTEHVQNYQWYTVTLSTVGVTPVLSDTVRVMPTDRFVYLPLVLK